jgi:myo-inositol-1(or 4)-monophosphatase
VSKEMLETAVEAARKAGRLLTELFPGKRDVWRKGRRDVVTDADVAAEEVILELISGRFPNHGVLSEEAGGGDEEATYLWVVDPLDGTRNYSRGLPFFGVSVAVLHDSRPIVGAVYDPVRDRMYTAIRDGGAWLNGDRLRVSEVARMDDALVGQDWGRTDEERAKALEIASRLLPGCSSLRAMGAAALGTVYVASGWLDGYVSLTVNPWDVAAGALAVTEAGGRCTTLEGAPYRAGSRGCVASNGRMHGLLLDIL